MRPSRALSLRLLSLALGTVLAVGLTEVVLRACGIAPPHLVTKHWLRNPQEPLLGYQCYTDNYSGELSPAPHLSPGPWRLYNYMVPPARIPLERLKETPFCVEYRQIATAATNGATLRGDPP